MADGSGLRYSLLMRTGLKISLASLVALNIMAGSAGAAPRTVEVQVGPDGASVYSPSAVHVRMGDAVRWTWGSDGHTVTHANSLSGFDSGVLGTGATFSHTFVWAGTYRYSSTGEDGMHGIVRVPMRIQPHQPDEQTAIRFVVGTVDVAEPLWYQVAGRFPGGDWVNAYISRTGSFTAGPLPSGTKQYRVRVMNFGTREHTGWSPVETLTISD